MKVGRRDFSEFARKLVSPSNYQALPRIVETHKRPLSIIVDEVLTRGEYPRTVHLRTPIGEIKARLWSPADLSTLNLAFCRRDYFAPTPLNTVVDIGSNIGLTSLYWLTRDPECFVFAYEPAPRTFIRLTENLRSFSQRTEAHPVAVSDFHGEADLGLDDSGVTSSLNLKSETSVRCDVVHINDVLENALTKRGRIDVLKMDSEGHELQSIRAIDPTFFELISVINLEKCGAADLLPREYHRTERGSAERYVHA